MALMRHGLSEQILSVDQLLYLSRAEKIFELFSEAASG